MICPECDKHNNDDVRFCRQCGERMERQTCANGHTIPEGLEDCPYCPRRGATPEVVGSTSADGHAERPQRTVVVAPGPDGGPPSGSVATVRPPGGEPATTTLAGFIVTFSTDPLGQFWPLRSGRTRIGSSTEADVSVQHESISAEHARVIVRDDEGTPRIWVEDGGSQNGTRLNGKEIFNERPALASGDVLSVGPVELRLLLLG